jgi:hypothetical protein
MRHLWLVPRFAHQPERPAMQLPSWLLAAKRDVRRPSLASRVLNRGWSAADALILYTSNRRGSRQGVTHDRCAGDR